MNWDNKEVNIVIEIKAHKNRLDSEIADFLDEAGRNCDNVPIVHFLGNSLRYRGCCYSARLSTNYVDIIANSTEKRIVQ